MQSSFFLFLSICLTVPFSHRAHARSMEAGGGVKAGPSNRIMERITEFSTLTSGNSMMLAEILSASVADPWFFFFFFL